MSAASVRPTAGYGGELDRVVWERVRASMNFEEGDRVPIWDYIDNSAVIRYFASGDDDYVAKMVRVYHGLGIDLCRGFGGSYDEHQEGQVFEEGKVRRKISGRTSWVTAYPIQSIEELKEYRPEPVSEEWLEREWVRGIQEQQKRFAPYTLYVPGYGCGFHATYGLMGQVMFCYAIYDALSDVLRVIEVMNESAVRVAKVTAKYQLSPLFVIGDDIAYKNKLMFSPDFLHKTFFPCLRRCIEPLHEAGIKVVYHSDGYLMDIMDDLLDAGIDGLNPIEPLAGMDLASLKKRYGKRLILVGGMDCSQLLPLSTPERIVEAVKEAVRSAGPGGGFFIGSSSEIVPATPLENVLTFYQACREWGRYPIG